MAKKVSLCILVFCLIGGVFCAGFYVGNRRSKAIIGEFEKRLEFVTNINKELQVENRRITELNSILSRRLDRAKEIIDGFSKQVDTDGDTIQRAIDTVSRLEQLLSVLFEAK